MAEGTSSLSEEPVAASIPKPSWRGRLHQVALVIAIPATIRLVAAAPSGEVRVATAIYALSLVGLFAASSAYHGLNWSQPALGRMRSLDHSMIFLLIAGTYTAFGALALRGLWRLLVLAVVWTGALVGITIKLFKIDRLSPVASALYMALGWTGVIALPQVLSDLGALPVVLIVAGGLMYTVGAVVLLRRRPDPNPHVFGYHEVWHALVVAASTCHYAAVTVMLGAAA
jgi:hemolysin III